MLENTVAVRDSVTQGADVWLTAREAAQRARCGVKVVYRASRARRLRAVRLGGRRELRFRPSWVDSWLESLELRDVREPGRSPV
jgi:excisionase family DNA binding protein